MKHIVISAQMGAVSNLIRNIVLLSPDVNWTISNSRLDTVLKQYNPALKDDKSEWTNIENMFNHRLGNHFLMNLDYFSVQRRLNYDLPEAFINHSLFWGLPTNFIQQLDFLDIVFIMPSTTFGLEWQTRAATEKVIIPNLKKQHDFKSFCQHDFCFNPDEKQIKIADYINQHGLENYIKFNALNMREVFRQQQQDLRQAIADKPVTVIGLEDIILGSAELISKTLSQALTIQLDHTQVATVLEAWQSLHWAPQETFDWAYVWENNTDFLNE